MKSYRNKYYIYTAILLLIGFRELFLFLALNASIYLGAFFVFHYLERKQITKVFSFICNLHTYLYYFYIINKTNQKNQKQ